MLTTYIASRSQRANRTPAHEGGAFVEMFLQSCSQGVLGVLLLKGVDFSLAC